MFIISINTYDLTVLQRKAMIHACVSNSREEDQSLEQLKHTIEVLAKFDSFAGEQIELTNEALNVTAPEDKEGNPRMLIIRKL